MVKKTEHKKNSEKDFLRYASGEMTEQERNAFEKNLEKDPFEKDAWEGMSSLRPGELKEDLSGLRQRISGGGAASKRIIYYRLAAGLAILFVVSSLFYYLVYQKIPGKAGSQFITESTEAREKENTSPASEVPEVPETLEVAPLAGQGAGKKDRVKEEEFTPSMEYDNSEKQKSLNKGVSQVTPSMAMADEEAETVVPEFDGREPGKAEAKISPDSRVSAAESYPGKKIRGKVVSAENYKPLAGVRVSLTGEDETVNTDTGGYFEISTSQPGDQPGVLEMDYKGMEKLALQAESGPEMNIVMNPVYPAEEKAAVEKSGAGKAAAAVQMMDMEMEVKDAAPLKGMEVFKIYIRDNQRFPETNPDITFAKVVLDFLVDASGKPSRIKIVESPGREFSDEAKRLLEEGPLWSRAVPVNHFTRIIIEFEKH